MLTPDKVTAKELAGSAVRAKLTQAAGNGAPIGGLKVETEDGWFAARPSGTENIYKLYAESFRGAASRRDGERGARAGDGGVELARD